jgi:hypothetical protein
MGIKITPYKYYQIYNYYKLQLYTSLLTIYNL